MKACVRIERPGDVPVTMTVTMTLGQWKKVDWKLANAPNQDGFCHTCGAFQAMIASLVNKAEAEFSESREIER